MTAEAAAEEDLISPRRLRGTTCTPVGYATFMDGTESRVIYVVVGFTMRPSMRKSKWLALTLVNPKPK